MVEIHSQHQVDAKLLPRIVAVEIRHDAAERGCPVGWLAIAQTAAHSHLNDVARLGGAVVICPIIAISGILRLQVPPQIAHHPTFLLGGEVQFLLNNLAALITLGEMLVRISGKHIVALAFHKSVEESRCLEIEDAVIKQKVLVGNLHPYHGVAI